MATIKSPAATLTVQTNILGATPEILAFNSGHFYPGSNTREWWRYAGVTGARFFISPSTIESSDDVAPVGDNVNSAATFLARRAAIRTNQFNSSYINWPTFTNKYESTDLYPNNHIRVNYALGELRKMGVEICAQVTASQSRFPIADTNDWPNMWELWQHYYAQAFYLGRSFEVAHYQMFNEPNHSSANGLTQTNFLLRLQLASDAIQCALEDVNRLYGRNLAPAVLAPVTSGSADGSYPGWGEMVIHNRHVNFLGQTVTNSLIQVYDYHQYNSTPANFGSDLAALHSLLTADMAPEPRYPTAISEFNTRMGATFDTMEETLDSPTEYPRFGSICVNLMANQCSELYCFKFSQTLRDPPTTYPVAKNAMHYVDNSNSPYNVGGITKAGEVWRLFNKAFHRGRSRLGTIKGSGATGLDVHAAYDPAAQRYYLFSANNTAGGVSLDMVVSALGVPTGNRVLLEEVSETNYGGGRLWTTLPANQTVSAMQPAYSVWLLTAPARIQQPEQVILASDDAGVLDGANKNSNYGAATSMVARNDPASTANRGAAFMKFQLPVTNLASIELAILSVHAACATINTTAQAHVYCLTNASWSEGSITWSTAPNLRDNLSAGNTIARSVIEGVGTNAGIVGQLVVTSTNAIEKLIDLTDFLRSRTNRDLTFVVVQDPRWDVTLPTLETGDTQPDGVRILTREAGAAPSLRLVLAGELPVADTDAYGVNEDTPLIVAAPGVLGNDIGAVSAVLDSGPAHGVLVLNPDGGFDYQPATNYYGQDSFTYKAVSGSGESSATPVVITVAPVNDPPAALDDTATAVQNGAVAVAVLANDTDADGDALSIVSFTQGTEGSVSDNGDGTLTYSPQTDFSGDDTFSYTIGDGHGGTAGAMVHLTVQRASGATNLVAIAEANIRGGSYAPADVDEPAQGYLMVKSSTDLSFCRKAYFQFDMTGFSGDTSKAAVFSINYQAANPHAVQLWALNQAYPGLSANITWNTAQANDTGSGESLLTSGPLTATRIGPASLLQPASANDWHWFLFTNWGAYVFNGRITLVLTGLIDPANSAGGLRIDRLQSVLSVPPAATPPLPVASHWDVYLAAGQSNMDGRGGNHHLIGALSPWSQPQADVRIWYANPLNYNHPLTPNYNTGWRVLEPGFSVPGDFSPNPVPSPCFGPELSFATSMATAEQNQRVALIKVSQGGTDLNTEWKPGSGYMHICLTNTVRTALEALTAEGADYTLRGMIWHQGESDNTANGAAGYETNLTQFIAALRRDLGVANLPFVIGELATNQNLTIRQAQFIVAENVPFVGFASSSNLATLAPADPHFDSDGVLIMGQRLAAVLEVPPIHFTGIAATADNLVLTASGLAHARCRLLTGTDLAVPLAEWTAVVTHRFDADGLATFSLPFPGDSRRFFCIRGD